MSDKPKGQPVKLFVTSCSLVHSGTNSRGDDYSIYDVQALREDRTPITDKKLRSFEDLPLGELLDLTVTRFDSEKYGTSWTLSRKSRGAHQRISNLTEKIKNLEDTLAAVVARLEIVERVLGERATKAELDEKFGADVPY